MSLTPAIVRYAYHGVHVDADGRRAAPQHGVRQDLASRGGPPLHAPGAGGDARRPRRQGPADRRRSAARRRCCPSPRTSPSRATAAATPTTARSDRCSRRSWRCATTPSRRTATQRPIRVGAAGGLGTPQAVAAAFALGAAYVLTGIGQPGVRRVRAVGRGQADARRGRHRRRDDGAGRRHVRDGRQAAGAQARHDVRGRGRASCTTCTGRIRRSRRSRRPSATSSRRRSSARPSTRAGKRRARSGPNAIPEQVAEAERDPRHKMALVFRWYLGLSSRWAIDGTRGRADSTTRSGAGRRWGRSTSGPPGRSSPSRRTARSSRSRDNLLEGAAVADARPPVPHVRCCGATGGLPLSAPTARMNETAQDAGANRSCRRNEEPR